MALGGLPEKFYCIKGVGMDTEQRIIELFDSACIKQFESLGCEVEGVGLLAHSGDIHRAYIEATSEELSVMLCLNVSRKLLLQTMPTVGSADESLIKDWILELANRFLGRLKNKLISHSCVLKMGLPQFCADDQAQKSLQNKFVQTARYFEINNEVVECCLFIDISDDAEALSEYEDEDEDWFEESELEHL